MGCDIHTFYERRNKDTGLWENITPGQWEIDTCVDDPDDVPQRYWSQPYRNNKYYIGRNYWLFGLIAGVRWASEYSMESKGFPGDPCDVTAEEYERWGDDAHTPSYLSAAELLAFIQEHCTPEAKMRALVHRKNQDQEILDNAESTLTTLAQNMLELAGEGTDPADVRMVFWFDN